MYTRKKQEEEGRRGKEKEGEGRKRKVKKEGKKSEEGWEERQTERRDQDLRRKKNSGVNFFF
jgi:hypothetical protein